jgi:two-component system response regulator GlrR
MDGVVCRWTRNTKIMQPSTATCPWPTYAAGPATIQPPKLGRAGVGSGDVMAKSVRKPGRILIVEDEKPLLDIIVMILESRGWSCASTREGPRALEIEHSKGPFDAALFDLHVGGASGLVLATELRARRPALPIILMSGTSDRDLTEEIESIGHAAFLRKPFGIDTLEAALSKAIRR